MQNQGPDENNDNIRISAISAIDTKSRSIGLDEGGLPWHIREDFQYFKQTTTEHPIIMGKTTWEEFSGRPLPNRPHIILAKEKDYKLRYPADRNDIFLTNDIQTAINLAKQIELESDNEQREIFIIGGASVYALALPFCQRLYLTLVDAGIDTNKKFPDYTSAGFTKKIWSKKSSDENYKYEFVILEK